MERQVDSSGFALQSSLQQRLEALSSTLKQKRIIVGCRVSGETHYAAVSSEPQPVINPAEWTFPTGCITKLFTGALIDREVRSGRLALHEHAVRFLDGIENADAVSGVTLKDLLNHTHGLDDSSIAPVPLDTHGFIDAAALLGRLGGRRLAPAGEFYSYSNIGSWLLATILERLNGHPFSEQLRHNLFEPLGIQVAASPTIAPLCASTGGTLAVSVGDLMRFLEFAALSRPDAFHVCSEDDITALPGWSAMQRGVFRGWSTYGTDWVGHNSTTPDASALVRAQPRNDIAVVIASGGHAASLIAARLFSDLLTEYKALGFPSALPAEAAAQLDVPSYCGEYCSATRTLSVTATPEGQLRLRGPGIDAALMPAANDVFSTRPANAQLFFVQFLRREADFFRYLWDGRCVYPRRIA